MTSIRFPISYSLELILQANRAAAVDSSVARSREISHFLGNFKTLWEKGKFASEHGRNGKFLILLLTCTWTYKS